MRKIKKGRNRRQPSNVYKKHPEGVYRLIDVPKVFSVLKNPEETIRFFHELQQRLTDRKRTELNLRGVELLTTDALMYLLALIDIFEQQGVVLLRGNVPRAPDVRRLIDASGFLNIIARRRVTDRSDPDPEVMAIRMGRRGEPQIAKEVARFGPDKIDTSGEGARLRAQEAAIYATLMECMGNTNQHAYRSNLPYAPKWWIMAVHDAVKETVNITILDYGQGIPRTIRKRVLEGVGQRLPRRIFGRDNRLALSALKGEDRSRTGEDFHGKGLPQIYGHSTEGLISGLTIVSGHAHVSLDKREHWDTTKPFQGTLISFRVAAAKDVPEGQER